MRRFAFALVLGTCLAFPVAADADLRKLLPDFVRPSSIPFPADNPYSREKAELGQKLFFDTRLSGDDTRSCATCHAPEMGWQDGMPQNMGLDGTPLSRRTPTVLNSAWGELFFWDGRADSLEAQALGPIQNEREMNQGLDKLVELLAAVPNYPKLFAAAFPADPRITPDNIGKAIATFERTAISGEAPFDRWVRGDETAVDAAAKRGFAVFTGKGGCVACHSGWNFTDHAFHDVGLPSADRGRGATLGLPELDHAFKTPTLRDVAERAPYMHDGSIASLEGVIDHYRTGIVDRPTVSPDLRRIDLTSGEAADLVAFLKSLSADPKVTGIPDTAATVPAEQPVDTVPMVIQRDKQFSHSRVKLRLGNTLIIDNQDTRGHNIRVYEENMELDSGYQHPGEKVSMTFQHPGLYHVFCGIHPKMKLLVEVEP